MLNVDDTFASVDLSAEVVLVDAQAGIQAPVGEVVAEQREALVDIVSLAQALQEHPRQFGMRGVERRRHLAIVS